MRPQKSERVAEVVGRFHILFGERDAELPGTRDGRLKSAVHTFEDADDLIPEPGPIITQLGDVWELSDHVVFAGNALDEASYSVIMDQDEADLVFSDPPYNVPIQGHGNLQHIGAGHSEKVDHWVLMRRSFPPGRIPTIMPIARWSRHRPAR